MLNKSQLEQYRHMADIKNAYEINTSISAGGVRTMEVKYYVPENVSLEPKKPNEITIRIQMQMPHCDEVIITRSLPIEREDEVWKFLADIDK